mmetsp:Transcript_24563/g.84049  ORF Transcript_24563/g.84049 Transcript_24563/m.84049 type:complete len:562 (+) Transcript_24563:2213-3898(+)
MRADAGRVCPSRGLGPEVRRASRRLGHRPRPLAPRRGAADVAPLVRRGAGSGAPRAALLQERHVEDFRRLRGLQNGEAQGRASGSAAPRRFGSGAAGGHGALGRRDAPARRRRDEPPLRPLAGNGQEGGGRRDELGAAGEGRTGQVGLPSGARCRTRPLGAAGTLGPRPGQGLRSRRDRGQAHGDAPPAAAATRPLGAEPLKQGGLARARRGAHARAGCGPALLLLRLEMLRFGGLVSRLEQRSALKRRAVDARRPRDVAQKGPPATRRDGLSPARLGRQRRCPGHGLPSQAAARPLGPGRLAAGGESAAAEARRRAAERRRHGMRRRGARTGRRALCTPRRGPAAQAVGSPVSESPPRPEPRQPQVVGLAKRIWAAAHRAPRRPPPRLGPRLRRRDGVCARLRLVRNGHRAVVGLDGGRFGVRLGFGEARFFGGGGAGLRRRLEPGLSARGESTVLGATRRSRGPRRGAAPCAGQRRLRCGVLRARQSALAPLAQRSATRRRGRVPSLTAVHRGAGKCESPGQRPVGGNPVQRRQRPRQRSRRAGRRGLQRVGRGGGDGR